MDNKKNNIGLIIAFIIVLIIAIGGIFGTYYFYSKSKTSENVTNCIKENNFSNTNITFKEYAKILEKNEKEEFFSIPNPYHSIVSQVYLKNQEVYFQLANEIRVNDTIKEQYEIFKKNKKDELIKRDNTNFTDLYYKIPINNVILVDVLRIGQDDSSIILMETSDGKVYSYVPNNNYFNENNDLNIIEEEKFKNIVYFSNYVHNENGMEFYGIDINGNNIDSVN